jgi:pimeloyl-ACP methyl ester carboxylesterase
MESRAPLPLHRLHDEEIERLLASGERRHELTALFGAAGYRELSALARRAAVSRVRGGPVTYLLPGLMGSRIGTRGRLLDDVLWLDPVEIAAGHLTRLALPRGARLAALGVMLLNALKLKFSLQIAGCDARFHAYDWRRSIERLADELNARIVADGVRDPMVVGHSMGGVVARMALAGDAGRIARVIQLGAPNFGSFAPVLALRGVYPTVRKLAALDLRHDAEDIARLVFRTLPSLHELLPDASRSGGSDLFDTASWPDDSLRPDLDLLAAAAAARRRWPVGDPRCLHIVGVRQETVTQVALKGREFHFHVTADGDGTVPRVLAEVPGSQVWFAAEKHGGLPNNGKVISAVVDLLREGRTDRLPTTHRARSRTLRIVAESALRRIAPHKVRWQDLSPDARRRLLEPVVSPEFHGAVSRDVLRARTQQGRVARPLPKRPLEIRLSHGSIVEANARALVLGVFRNVDPSGAATAVDDRLGGAVREFTLRRMFSGHLGQVFILPSARDALLAEFVLFAGLGDFDEFGSDAQAFVAENVVRTFARTHVQDFATVLFGTGSGIPVATALEQQLRGFLDGLRHADGDRVIRRITICEIDPRRYATLRRILSRIVTPLAGEDLEIVVDESAPSAEPPPAPVKARAARRQGTATDPAYLMVTLLEQGRSDYECRSSLLTAGAKAAVLSGTARFGRSELRATLAQVEPGVLSIREMARFGAGLARLLLPPPVREGLAAMNRRPLVIVHDREAARVPWEALHVGDAHPALERGLSRRYASESLSVARWREDRRPGERPHVLMVINPTLDLPGAAAEGAALRKALRDGEVQVDYLEGRDAARGRLLREIGSGLYDVLHFAGHGFFDASDPGRSGLVCAGGDVLRGADLDGIGDLPALVFFNACEAARVRKPGVRGRRGLFGLRKSSSLAEAFLNGGVANFVGTHWPVGDDAALAFSTRFYERLLAGERLGDAMLAARRRVFEQDSIDWADYVHYGNPAFLMAFPGHDRNP